MPGSLIAIRDALPYLLRGSLVTLIVVVGAMGLGLVLGVPLAVGQVYGHPALRRVIAVYVWFFRGIPLLVLLFLFYFGLCTALDINLSAFAVAIVVLGLISSAYQSQIFRGAILSLPEGQFKAARALAMDPKVMLLDEPTSALDPELVGEVHAVIRDLGNNGMTMIMATHQIGFARSLASEIIFMEDGRILERGTPDKIFNHAENDRTREFCSKITELYGER